MRLLMLSIKPPEILKAGSQARKTRLARLVERPDWRRCLGQEAAY
jgi:hypothetical protein